MTGIHEPDAIGGNTARSCGAMIRWGLALALAWSGVETAVADSSRTLLIMPMGDSITVGVGDDAGGYRAPLHALLQGGGFSFDFVGGKTTPGDPCPDQDHWAAVGWQITDTPATIAGRHYLSIQGENRSGLYDEMASAISTDHFSIETATTRNIILLQIGINDVLHQVVDDAHGTFDGDPDRDGRGDGQEWVAEGMIARLQALLRSIDGLAASRGLRIEVLLGTLCRPTAAWKGDAVSDVLIAEVGEYHAAITRSVIPAMTFSNISVKVVDQLAPANGKLGDGLHPDEAGSAAMARAWYNAITVTSGDVAYGPDRIRNSLDFWRASGNGPRPLLITIHGGGWNSGEKVFHFDARPWLDRGISCASITYRSTPGHPLPAPVHDAARAVQFLRTKAAEWNIDPDRIAVSGGSAGACTSMWLLLHDDLADPGSADPVLRQSSRVCAALAFAGQTSIDPPVIQHWIGAKVLTHLMIPNAVGQPSMANVWPSVNYERVYKGTYQEFSPINHLDANDPPLYLEYDQPMTLPARTTSHAIHHPQFGLKLWEKSAAAAAGHECHLRVPGPNRQVEYRKTTPNGYASGEEFLMSKLCGRGAR
jgi:acetyl esterase/lipase